MNSSSSFRGRVVRTLKSWLKPEWLFRQQRQRKIASRYARLSEASSRGIVASTVEAFRSLFAPSRSPSRRRGGLDLGFVRSSSEALEPRRLLSATLYVGQVANDWIAEPSGAHPPSLGSTNVEYKVGSSVEVTGLVYGGSATGTGYTAFTSISAALSQAALDNDGDTIDLLSGTCSGLTTLSVPNMIFQPAPGEASVVSLQGSGGGAIDVTASGVQILGFTDNISANGYTAITIESTANNFTITGNTIAQSKTGIAVGPGMISGSLTGTISGSTFTDTNGISVNAGSGTVGISGGSISGDSNGVGIDAVSGTVVVSSISIGLGSNLTGINVAGAATTVSGTVFSVPAGTNSTDLQFDSGSLTLGTDNQFFGTTYIDNQTSTAINATAAGTQFGGVTPTALSLTNQSQLDQIYPIEDQIHDALSAGSAYGLVRLVPGADFVSHVSGTIGNGVAAASSGDTVYIQSGSYTENVSVGKNLTLQGVFDTTSDSATTLTGNLSITAGTVAVKDLTISGGSGTGITISAGSVSLSQDTISGYTTGVDVSGGSLTATQNIITSNTTGVSVDSGAGSVTLGGTAADSGNSIAGNTGAVSWTTPVERSRPPATGGAAPMAPRRRSINTRPFWGSPPVTWSVAAALPRLPLGSRTAPIPIPPHPASGMRPPIRLRPP